MLPTGYCDHILSVPFAESLQIKNNLVMLLFGKYNHFWFGQNINMKHFLQYTCVKFFSKYLMVPIVVVVIVSDASHPRPSSDRI